MSGMIRAMVEESIGYVSEEEKAQLHSWEQQREQEKEAARQNSTPATVFNQGIGTALDLGEKALQGKVIAESGGVVGSRPRRVTRTIEETVESTQDVSDGFGY